MASDAPTSAALPSHRIADLDDPPRLLRRLSWLATGALILLGLAELAAVPLDGLYAARLDDRLGGAATAAEVEDARDAVVGIDVTRMGLTLAAAAAFLPWFHRAYANLGRMSVAELRYDTEWAVGGWFVPILNLIRPKEIADDAWRASDAGAEVTTAAWRSQRVSPLLHWWWGLLIVSGFLFGFGFAAIGEEGAPATREDVEAEQGTVGVAIIGSLVALAAIVLAVLIVTRLTRRQDSLIEAVTAGPAGPLVAERPAVAAEAAPRAGVPVEELAGRWRCALCGWVFGARRDAERHVGVHHPGERPG